MTSIAEPSTAPRESARKTLALHKIVEHAARIGLPEPIHITASGFAPISLGFDSLADLTDWALWMETPIGEARPVPVKAAGKPGLLYQAEGAALDEPIQVWAIAEVTA